MKTEDAKKLKERLKNLLRGYKHMNNRTRQGLKELGFRIKSGRTHIKIFYGDDMTHAVTVSVSASDWRTGLNMAQQLATILPAC